MHSGQLAVTPETVRALTKAQFPRWADLPVTRVHGEGTVNAIFRLGEALVARLPLQPGDVGTTQRRLEAEAAATRELHRHSPFPVPEPVALGRPGSGYPLPWSIQTWLPGATATEEDPAESAGFARDLAELIGALRSVPTDGRTFTGDNRGGDLRRHDAWMAECFANSEGLLDVARLQRLWQRLRALPRDAPDAMTHGDLVPGNVLVSGGRLAGVLDAGGFGPADPALDLVGAWHLLDDRRRGILRAELGCDDLEWARGMAWAFEQAMGLVWYYADTNPAMSRVGRRTLDRILASLAG